MVGCSLPRVGLAVSSFSPSTATEASIFSPKRFGWNLQPLIHHKSQQATVLIPLLGKNFL